MLYNYILFYLAIALHLAALSVSLHVGSKVKLAYTSTPLLIYRGLNTIYSSCTIHRSNSLQSDSIFSLERTDRLVLSSLHEGEGDLWGKLHPSMMDTFRRRGLISEELYQNLTSYGYARIRNANGEVYWEPENDSDLLNDGSVGVIIDVLGFCPNDQGLPGLPSPFKYKVNVPKKGIGFQNFTEENLIEAIPLPPLSANNSLEVGDLVIPVRTPSKYCQHTVDMLFHFYRNFAFDSVVDIIGIIQELPKSPSLVTSRSCTDKCYNDEKVMDSSTGEARQEDTSYASDVGNLRIEFERIIQEEARLRPTVGDEVKVT